MARRHLRELLTEEQEPFALQSFVDERRRNLRGTYGRAAPPSPPRLCHRHLQLRAGSDFKKSPLWPGSQTAGAMLVEAATRVQRRRSVQKRRRSRRRRKGTTEEGLPRPFGFGFLASLFKRLVPRKQRRIEIGSQEKEEALAEKRPPESFIELELHHGETQSDVPAARRRQREPDNDGEPKEEHHQQSFERFIRDGVEPCPAATGASPVEPGGVILSPPELRTPPASPTRRRTEGQLFGERPGEEKKEQYSPVSVLDPPSDEDDDAQEDGDEEAGGDEDHRVDNSHRRKIDEDADGHVVVDGDSSCRSTKQEQLPRIRRLERLAGLDPLELDRRIVADDEEDDDDGGRGGWKRPRTPALCAEKLGFRRGIIRMMEMDMRREASDGWRRFPDQVAEVAAAVSALLAAELAEDFVLMLR